MKEPITLKRPREPITIEDATDAAIAVLHPPPDVAPVLPDPTEFEDFFLLSVDDLSVEVAENIAAAVKSSQLLIEGSEQKISENCSITSPPNTLDYAKLKLTIYSRIPHVELFFVKKAVESAISKFYPAGLEVNISGSLGKGSSGGGTNSSIVAIKGWVYDVKTSAQVPHRRSNSGGIGGVGACKTSSYIHKAPFDSNTPHKIHPTFIAIVERMQMYGRVVKAEFNPKGSKGQGFGLIEFANPDDAELCRKSELGRGVYVQYVDALTNEATEDLPAEAIDKQVIVAKIVKTDEESQKDKWVGRLTLDKYATVRRVHNPEMQALFNHKYAKQVVEEKMDRQPARSTASLNTWRPPSVASVQVGYGGGGISGNPNNAGGGGGGQHQYYGSGNPNNAGGYGGGQQYGGGGQYGGMRR
jgi:hypothetical protein